MPYASIEDLPPPVQAHLPLHAQEIYLGAFNNAWIEYAARGPTQRETHRPSRGLGGGEAQIPANPATNGVRAKSMSDRSMTRAD